MRFATRRLAGPALIAALATVMTGFAAPVLAKEGLDAQFEAPIARDTPGGTTLLLGVWVTMTDETGTHDIEGSPVYIRITGPDGASASAIATQSRPGHYTIRLTVPESGVKAVEVGMRGTTDLPFNLVGFTIVPGPISGKTAQVAPPIAAAATPLARASVPAPGVVAPLVPAANPGTTTAPTAARVESGAVPIVVAALALVAAALVILALVRMAAHPRAAGRAPEA